MQSHISTFPLNSQIIADSDIIAIIKHDLVFYINRNIRIYENGRSIQ